MPAATSTAALDRASGTEHASSRGRWIALFGVAWLLSAAICFRLAFAPGYPGDVAHYKFWTRVITTQGIQSIYSGSYPESYAIYPPVTLYAYGLAGRLYERTAFNPWDTERMLASEGFSTVIKGVAITFFLALGLTCFAMLWALYGVRAGAIGGAALVLNPAGIFDSAYWGQPNGAHSLLAVAALGMLLVGRWRESWLAAGLAAMTKPQAWALAPLFALAQVRVRGWRRTAVGTAMAAVVALVVMLPFLAHGRLSDFLTLPSQIAGVMPVASANAHNLWWIVSGNPGGFHLDSEPVLGRFTYRQVALPLVLGVAACTLWRYWRTPATSIFLLAAYQTFGWFMFTTQAHEDHLFMILPLLLMAAPVAPIARTLFILLSATLLANMVLHDPLLIDRVGDAVPELTRWRLQVFNSWVNLLAFAVWSWALVARPRWIGSDTRPAAKSH